MFFVVLALLDFVVATTILDVSIQSLNVIRVELYGEKIMPDHPVVWWEEQSGPGFIEIVKDIRGHLTLRGRIPHVKNANIHRSTNAIMAKFVEWASLMKQMVKDAPPHPQTLDQYRVPCCAMALGGLPSKLPCSILPGWKTDKTSYGRLSKPLTLRTFMGNPSTINKFQATVTVALPLLTMARLIAISTSSTNGWPYNYFGNTYGADEDYLDTELNMPVRWKGIFANGDRKEINAYLILLAQYVKEIVYTAAEFASCKAGVKICTVESTRLPYVIKSSLSIINNNVNSILPTGKDLEELIDYLAFDTTSPQVNSWDTTARELRASYDFEVQFPGSPGIKVKISTLLQDLLQPQPPTYLIALPADVGRAVAIEFQLQNMGDRTLTAEVVPSDVGLYTDIFECLASITENENINSPLDECFMSIMPIENDKENPIITNYKAKDWKVEPCANVWDQQPAQPAKPAAPKSRDVEAVKTSVGASLLPAACGAVLGAGLVLFVIHYKTRRGDLRRDLECYLAA